MASNILGSLLLLIKTKGDTSGLDKTDKAIKKTTTSLRKMSKSTGMLGSLSNKLFRGFNLSNLWNGAMGYVQFEKDLGAIHSRFYALTKDHKQASEEFDYIRNVAKDTAMDIKKTADSYSIFYSATRKTLGKEGARGVFEDWTRVGRVLHLSEYQFERVTYALREMASKGAIYSQDLRMQIGTHVPNAMGLAQKATEQMGITGTDWFEKLQKMAKGNTKVTTEFVKLFSKEARKAYGGEEAFREAMKQPDALVQTIKNAAFEVGYSFSKAGGGYMVVKILEGIRDTIAKIPFDKITKVLGVIAKTVGDIFSYLPKIFNILSIIAMNVAVFYAFRNIVKGLVFFKTLKRLMNILSLRFGKIGVLEHMFWASSFKDGVKNAISKALTGFGFKTLTRLGLNTIPVIGQILFGIMTIVDIILLIKNLLPHKDKNKLPEGMLTEKVSVDNVLSTLKSVRDAGITDPNVALNRVYGLYGREVGDLLKINNDNKIVININGTYTPEETAKQVVEELNKKFKKSIVAGNLSNRPATKKEQKAMKLIEEI